MYISPNVRSDISVLSVSLVLLSYKGLEEKFYEVAPTWSVRIRRRPISEELSIHRWIHTSNAHSFFYLPFKSNAHSFFLPHVYVKRPHISRWTLANIRNTPHRKLNNFQFTFFIEIIYSIEINRIEGMKMAVLKEIALNIRGKIWSIKIGKWKNIALINRGILNWRVTERKVHLENRFEAYKLASYW